MDMFDDHMCVYSTQVIWCLQDYLLNYLTKGIVSILHIKTIRLDIASGFRSQNIWQMLVEITL